MKHCLVADDSEVIRKVARAILERLHFEVTEAENGQQAVENPVHIHDWHATLLHLLGLDHERLTYSYAGRSFRLTNVYGRVVSDILS